MTEHIAELQSCTFVLVRRSFDAMIPLEGLYRPALYLLLVLGAVSV